jgi:hypothetical protein
MPAPKMSGGEVKTASERLEPEDLPTFAMRLDGSSTTEIAEVLREDRAVVERRVDRIVDALKPRVDPPALSAGTGELRSPVGRWL